MHQVEQLIRFTICLVLADLYFLVYDVAVDLIDAIGQERSRLKDKLINDNPQCPPIYRLTVRFALQKLG